MQKVLSFTYEPSPIKTEPFPPFPRLSRRIGREKRLANQPRHRRPRQAQGDKRDYRRADSARQPRPATRQARLRPARSFLPGPKKTIESKAKSLALSEFTLDNKSFTLEPNQVYLVELAETMNLPKDISAIASPKSSTGRLDVFTRLISDYGKYYDRLPAGYQGRCG